MALVALANHLEIPDSLGNWSSLESLPIYIQFFPAGGKEVIDLGSGPAPTVIYLPGSAGINLSERDEIGHQTTSGHHVFVIETNYSHVKYLHRNDEKQSSEGDLRRKASTAKNQLNANPLNQVADFARLYKILEKVSFVDADAISLHGDSLGGTAVLLAACGEILGPLTPGARFVETFDKEEGQNREAYDFWTGLPKFTAVVRSALPAVLPFYPRINQRLLVFIGAEDNYCEVAPMIFAMQKVSECLRVSCEVLEGGGHFWQANRDEYDTRVKNARRGGIIYRKKEDDFYMEKAQNLSGSCFRLGGPLSWFKRQNSEPIDDYMIRLTQATLVHMGTQPWESGEVRNLVNDYPKLDKAITYGASIKPDSDVTVYVHQRTQVLSKMPEEDFERLAHDQCCSLRSLDSLNPGELDLTSYSGFVSTQTMISYAHDPSEGAEEKF